MTTEKQPQQKIDQYIEETIKANVLADTPASQPPVVKAKVAMYVAAQACKMTLKAVHANNRRAELLHVATQLAAGMATFNHEEAVDRAEVLIDEVDRHGEPDGKS